MSRSRVARKAKRAIRRIGTSWNRFWFRADGRAQIRLFRAVFGALMLVFYGSRSLDLVFYYGEGGILPRETLHDLIVRPGSFTIFNYFPGDSALWLAQAAFLVSLAFLALGKLPRLAAGVALVIHLSFLHRNIAVAYGVDFITTFYLLYMVLADHREPSLRRGRDGASVVGSMAYRLCQLQVCVIYGYSGLHKLRGVRWWQGEAIWDVVANSQITRFDMTWLSSFPVVLLVANYGTLVWEIYFPALVWVRPLRGPLLVGGVLLHVGIASMINITFFSALMIATYIFFIERAHADAAYHFVSSKVASMLRKFKVSSQPADQSLV
jgi:hypothetical protein